MQDVGSRYYTFVWTAVLVARACRDQGIRVLVLASERALRPLALGRNAWLFFGSGDHAHAAANIFSLIASCVLHGLDAES